MEKVISDQMVGTYSPPRLQDTDYWRLFHRHAARLMGDGLPVFVKKFWLEPDGSVTKGSFRCKACKADGHAPVDCPGCESLTCHGEHRATLNPARFDAMLAEALGDLWGTATLALTVRLPAGVIALDVDRHDGQSDGYARLLQLNAHERRTGLPVVDVPTRWALSAGGGYHVWFRVPSGLAVPSHLFGARSGLEVKREGDVLIAPPTITPRGKAYGYAPRWEFDPAAKTAEPAGNDVWAAPAPIADAPAELLAILRGQHVTSETQKSAQAEQRKAVRLTQPASTYSQPAREHYTAEQVADLLRGLGKRVVRYGATYWAQCPAHPDSKPSLKVHERDGRTLLYCTAQCQPDTVLEALGLSFRNLFTDSEVLV